MKSMFNIKGVEILKTLKEYLKDNVLICDGAMGTYYSEITGNDAEYCEFANINNEEVIKRIHSEYIEAGAKLIRTNTFSANALTLEISREKVKEIITKGINIAKECVKDKDVYIGASIGPIRIEGLEDEEEKVLEELKFVVDCVLENDINIFVLETLSNTVNIKEITEYIKEKSPESFILTQFAIKPDGFSRDGISVNRIFEEISNLKSIDAYGLNCAMGPTSVYEILKNIDFKGNIISALPNAGYPMVIQERTVYTNNPEYFAKKMEKIKSLGVSIIGGCCGTKPSYIRGISSKIINKKIEIPYKKEEKTEVKNKVHNTFKEKLENNKFVTVIELSAPMDTDISGLMNGAKLCKENGIDLVTIPDSPMSRVRADSVLIASKVKREIGIEAMPHICCRDKNTNAIRSSILAGHIENIRNVLAITGDPVSDANKVETKNVFNLNSFKLINLIKDTNEQIFKGDKILIGGAFNPNVRNKEAEFNRMLKKIENGASFFLTQPIYDDETIEFLKSVKERTNTKILGGILPIVTYKNAQFLNNELPGVKIPEEIINRFSPDMTKEESEKVGIEIAVEIGKKLKGICDGLYFVTPFKRVYMLIEIIKKLNKNE